jgi:flagellar basal-body rod protein FlgC
MLLGDRFSSIFRIAARGLEAQRIALGTHTENIANAKTSRTEDGTPYQIKRAVHEVTQEDYTRFSEVLNRSTLDLQGSSAGASIGDPSLRRRLPEMDLGPSTEVAEQLDERLEYDPSHPDADENGYVRYPDINVVEEMSRMMSANRIYEANLSMVSAAKQMAKQTLQI